MNLYQKLNTALECCHLPSLKNRTAYRKIGAGAWHEAYLVYPRRGDKLVIRLRKKIIYGQERTFVEKELHEDYAPVGLFYRQANHCRPGSCPTLYDYHLDPDLTFTVESYMGPTLSLAKLTEPAAFAYGQQLGEFFRTVYALPPPVSGFGELVWEGTKLVGQQQQSLAEIWQAAQASFYEKLAHLRQSTFAFDYHRVKDKLERVLTERKFDQEPLTLINGDITPENLIVRRNRFAGLIDPVPRLHNGLRYAAFFIYCYQSYLPQLADAPRYAHHQFQLFRPVLQVLVEGYINGYTNNNIALRQKLAMECFLWAVEVADENLKRLQAELTPELYLRAGDKTQIAARLQRCLRELEDMT
jgi:hypothetical protein